MLNSKGRVMSESNDAQLAAPQWLPPPSDASAPIGGEPQDERDWLLQIAREMAGVHDLDRLLQMIVDAALCIVPSADKCVIHLLSDDGTRLLACVCSSPSPTPARGEGIPAGQGIAGRALRERTTIYVADTHNAVDYLPLHSGAEVRSLLVAALCVGQEALGTLSLSSSQVNAFRPAERQFANTLAAQAAVAIHQARLLTTALAERERSEAVLSSISEGLAVLDGEGRVVRVNPALCDIFWLNPQNVALPCAPEQFSAIAQLLNPSGAEIIGPYEMEMEIGGRAITVRATVSPIQSPSGGQVVVVRETTHERAAAQARRCSFRRCPTSCALRSNTSSASFHWPKRS
jgi:PAS domain-containing protein